MLHRMLSVIILVLVVARTVTMDTVKHNHTIATFKPTATYKPPLRTCNVTLNKTSAIFLAHSFDVWQPNFARIRLEMRGHYVDHLPEVIMPFHWVWTYYAIDGLFTYLKWPSDFHILSLSLLDARTLPKDHFLILNVENNTDCSLTIGEKNSTRNIAEALKNFTQKYLLKTKRGSALDYSYWCYQAEVPNSKQTTAYIVRKYTGFPMEIASYNCCHTRRFHEDEQNISLDCDMMQTKQTIEASIIPYFMSVIAFAFFPIFLFRASANLITSNSSTNLSESGREHLLVNDDEPAYNDYIYLTGSPPISFTTLMSNLCGLSTSFPVSVSRIRRFLLFVILPPSIIGIRITVYYHSSIRDLLLALINHNCSLGFLSMIGGYEKSREVFMTDLGGPYLMIIVFLVAGIFFVVAPEDLGPIFEMGTRRKRVYLSDHTPLFITLEQIEKYSITEITTSRGFARAAALCRGGVFMVTNPSFWSNVIKTQFQRLVGLYVHIKHKRGKVCASLITALLLPIVGSLHVLELVLTLALYGLPIINGMYITVKGYFLALDRSFQSNTILARLARSSVSKILTTLFLTIAFMYYVFSFCIIFTDTFVFISKVLIFCFLSVIVYPSTSFGYLFFGIVFIYYFFKCVTGFGEGYLELLADAVEVSTQLDDSPSRVQIMNETLIVDDVPNIGISKLQVNGKVIALSQAQKQEVQQSVNTRDSSVKYRNHVVGIPRDLFFNLVRKYRPVHIRITLIFVKIALIVILIAITFSVITAKPLGSNEGISEVMHIVFLVGIGALPKILEVAMDNMNHSIKKDILLRKMKSDFVHYWESRQQETSGVVSLTSS